MKIKIPNCIATLLISLTQKYPCAAMLPSIVFGGSLRIKFGKVVAPTRKLPDPDATDVESECTMYPLHPNRQDPGPEDFQENQEIDFRPL